MSLSYMHIYSTPSRVFSRSLSFLRFYTDLAVSVCLLKAGKGSGVSSKTTKFSHNISFAVKQFCIESRSISFLFIACSVLWTNTNLLWYLVHKKRYRWNKDEANSPTITKFVTYNQTPPILGNFIMYETEIYWRVSKIRPSRI